MSWKEKQKRNYENINKGSFSVTGEYDIPILEPVEYKYCDWIGFNYASSVKDRRGKGIHFFLEDYQLPGFGEISIIMYQCFPVMTAS